MVTIDQSARGPYRFTCPRCNAEIGQSCIGITHMGKFHGVRPHVARLILDEFEYSPPNPLCLK